MDFPAMLPFPGRFSETRVWCGGATNDLGDIIRLMVLCRLKIIMRSSWISKVFLYFFTSISQ